LSNWTMNGEQLVGGAYLSPAQVTDANWTVVGTGDYNQDGHPDILWQHATEGWISVWLMNGTTLMDGRLLSPSRVADTNWKIVGSGDFNGDGWADIVWQHQTTGETSVWIMNGTTLVSGTLLSPAGVGDTNWKIKAVTDLNGDGQPDLVWQNTATGYLAAWLMNGTIRTDGIYLAPAQVMDTGWHIVGPR
jgi:FG-GAP repeat.